MITEKFESHSVDFKFTGRSRRGESHVTDSDSHGRDSEFENFRATGKPQAKADSDGDPIQACHCCH